MVPKKLLKHLVISLICVRLSFFAQQTPFSIILWPVSCMNFHKKFIFYKLALLTVRCSASNFYFFQFFNYEFSRSPLHWLKTGRPKEGDRFQLVLAEWVIDYIWYPLEMFWIFSSVRLKVAKIFVGSPPSKCSMRLISDLPIHELDFQIHRRTGVEGSISLRFVN